MPDPITIQEILVVEQALKERIAAVEAELAAEGEALHAELAASCLSYAEALKQEGERRLAEVEQEAQTCAAAEIEQTATWCRRLDTCDDETLLRLLAPHLLRLLPGRGS